MLKKVLSIIMTMCLLLTILPSAVFAIDESGEIDAAMKAIRKNQDTVTLYNDMTADEFLSVIKKLLPEGSTVELSFSKESDYRVYNATSEKDGSIFANILFTCGPYTRHEMYDIKMPALTGEAAANNADKENLAKDLSAAREIFKGISLEPDVTAEDILNMVKAAVKNGSQVELTGDFTKVDSTETKKGSAKCSLKFTLNKETGTLKVNNTLKLLTPAEETKTPEETKPTEETKNDDNKTVTPIAFEDVADGAYYANAVKWAIEKNITKGTSDTTFSPDDTCTRAQILTFLWRAVGSPKATIENPFADLKISDYFYDAALWAYQKGMVSGDKFEGNTPCTRASTVVYLWKNVDEPEAQTLDVFSDVSAHSDYAEAVSWAVTNGVTSGVSDTEFAPDAICSRGQIVTFLNRAIKN